MDKRFKITLLITICILCFITIGMIINAENVKNEGEALPTPMITPMSTPAPLSSDDTALGNLCLGMDYEKVLQIMKVKPKKVDKQDSDFITLSYNDGVEIAITYGVAQDISVSCNKYPTPRGLVVGDTIERVLQLYGKPEMGEPGDSLWQYTSTDGNLFLSVFFEKNKVSLIEINVREI